MPLCILEIPRSQYNSLAPDTRDDAILTVCNQALDLTHDRLGIPDPKDRESRVVVKEGIDRPQISIAFTVGNVYPGFKPEYFSPSREQIHDLGTAIQEGTRGTQIEVAQTRIDAWSGTAWLPRSLESNEPQAPPESEFTTIVGHINQPKLTLVLSPAILKRVAVLKESEPQSEEEQHLGVAREIYSLVAESLRIPEQPDVQVEVQVPHYADADISVEFDCRVEKGHSIPEPVLEYVARRVEQLLNKNALTREGFAEIWIRQGEPATDTITSHEI